MDIRSALGSGSSAWAYNVSKVSDDVVGRILQNFIDSQSDEVKKNLGTVQFHSNLILFEHQALPISSCLASVIPNTRSLTSSVNSALLFDPEERKMRFVVRDPIDNR